MIDKYFTIEEAASLIPQLKEKLEEAYYEIHNAQSEVILQKRLVMMHEKENAGDVPEETLTLLKSKAERLEAAIDYWVSYFQKQGIILRDLRRGLIDFPYKSKTTDEVFFLCWQFEDDGLFYFHMPEDAPMSRQPITFLPE